MMPLREEGCSLGKTVKVRNLVIGEGMPKICVPITGRCEEDILAAARAVLEVPADMAEWRADWYDRAGSRDESAGNRRSRQIYSRDQRKI